MTDLQKNVLTIAGVGVVAWLIFRQASADTVDAVTDAVTPSSPDNLVFRGVNAVGDVFDDGKDDDSFDLGRSIFRLLNPDEYAKLKAAGAF